MEKETFNSIELVAKTAGKALGHSQAACIGVGIAIGLAFMRDERISSLSKRVDELEKEIKK